MLTLWCLLHLLFQSHRFEELEYADAASYMEDGKVVFTGSPAQMVARLKSMGASVL
jgi:energy-coupling factor transporter ATP-binding protein EcfA2